MKSLKNFCLTLSLILALNLIVPTITKAQSLNSPNLQTATVIQPPQEVVVFPYGPKVFKGLKLAPKLIPIIQTIVETANELIDLYNNYKDLNKEAHTEGSKPVSVSPSNRNYDFNIDNRDNFVGYGYPNNIERVRDVQHILNRRMNSGLVEDGLFGSKTSSAIKSFQNYWGLPADGVVGPTTWRVLITDNK